MAIPVGELLEAGRVSIQQASPDDARDAFSAVLEIEDVPESRLALADALWWLGELDQSVRCKERAFAALEDRGDHAQAAFAAMLLCLDQRKQYGDAVASCAWLARATRLVDDHGLQELRPFLLFATSFDCEDPTEAEALAREAHRLAVDTGDRDLELCTLSQIGVTLVDQGRVEEGVRYLDEAMAVSLGTASPETVVFTSCMMMTSCATCAQFARAAHWVKATMAFSERFGCPFLYTECRLHYGAVLFATGDWAAAGRLFSPDDESAPALPRL